MYQLRYHPGLETRWNSFPRHQKLIMIGNEMVRAQRMLEKKQWALAKQCYERALELTDLTVSSYTDHQQREFLRWRSQMAQLYITPRPSLKMNTLLTRTLLSFDSQSFQSLPPDFLPQQIQINMK